jgi:hypothetical protein
MWVLGGWQWCLLCCFDIVSRGAQTCWPRHLAGNRRLCNKGKMIKAQAGGFLCLFLAVAAAGIVAVQGEAPLLRSCRAVLGLGVRVLTLPSDMPYF